MRRWLSFFTRNSGVSYLLSYRLNAARERRITADGNKRLIAGEK